MVSRDIRLDNIKGILILLVVFTHFLWGYRSVAEVAPIVKVIYAFHMPAFIFVSGYLSKDSRDIPWRSVGFLFATYFVSNTLMLLFAILRGSNITLLKPYYSCWYVLALAFWRMILPLVSNKKHILPLSVLLSLTVGFCGEINNTFALARTIAFSPFFIAGFLARRHGVFARIRSAIPSNAASLAGLLIFLSGIAFIRAGGGYLEISTSDELMQAYSGGMVSGVLKRVFLLSSAAIVTFSLMLFVPSRRIPALSLLGKNSLSIYVFHRIPTLLFVMAFPADMFAGWYWPACLVVTALTTMLLGLNVVEESFRDLISSVVVVSKNVAHSDDCRIICVVVAILSCVFVLSHFL